MCWGGGGRNKAITITVLESSVVQQQPEGLLLALFPAILKEILLSAIQEIPAHCWLPNLLSLANMRDNLHLFQNVLKGFSSHLYSIRDPTVLLLVICHLYCH